MSAEDFKRLFLPQHSYIRNVCRAMLPSQADADDAVQEIFLKLWERREQLKLPENLTAYIVRVARNHCLDRLRSTQRSPSQLSLDDESYTLQPSDSSFEASQAIELRETEELFRQWHQALSEQKRQVFDLSHREQMSNSEIASKLKLSEVNVRVTLSRLRQELRSRILNSGLAKASS